MKGYYLDAGSNDESKTVISCNGTKCEAIPIIDSTCNPGKVIDSDGIKLCINENDTKSIEVAINNDATPSYETLTIIANGFPGATVAGNIAVKLNTDGSALLMERASLPICKNEQSNSTKCKDSSNNIVPHCILGGKIYKSGDEDSTTCTLITSDSSGTISNLYKNDGTLSSDGVDATMAYQCTFGSDDSKTLEKCILVQGYVTVGSDIYQCNGWKGEVCQKLEDSDISECSEDTKNGILGKNDSNNILCFSDTTSFLLPDTYSVLAFKLSETSSKYGMMTNEIVKLNLTAIEADNENGIIANTQALVTSFGSGKDFYLFFKKNS